MPGGRFAGKAIAITGGASGIGLATAHLLASEGATLSLADVQVGPLTEAVQTLQTQYNVAVSSRVVDVRHADQVDEWIASTVEQHGRLDGAANMAGVLGRNLGIKPVSEIENDDWDFVLGVNLTGVMHCLRAELRAIADGGSIVNAASIAGVQGRPCSGPYSASKHAVIGLTRSAAKEVGSKGVRVNAVAPGSINTPQNAQASQIVAGAGAASNSRDAEILKVALGRRGEAHEVAKLIAFLLSDDSTFITGAVYSIDGGWNC